MKKSTLLIILVVYIASIAIINFFGMNVKLYDEIVNVTAVECLNETDKTTEVGESNGKKVLRVKFTTPADPTNLTGTMLQLVWRVKPDNATNKDVQFVYDTNNTRVTFYKDERGNETGLLLFSGPTMLDVQIMSTDGRRIGTSVLVWVYA